MAALFNSRCEGDAEQSELTLCWAEWLPSLVVGAYSKESYGPDYGGLHEIKE